MRQARLALALALPFALSAAASANIVISNVSVLGTSIVNQSYQGSNGYTFVFDAGTSAVKGNGASKSITLNYTVTSTDQLVGYQFSPLGTAFRGDVNASVSHGAQTDNYSWSSPLSAPAVSDLAQPASKTLSGLYTYNVATTIDLSTLSATPRNRVGVAALTQYNVSYETQAVPEPASLVALAIGGLAIARRRKNRR
ncbi:PEP-CTERM sorting domain-containing protein [bacterium]|nr:MAG: PEP-CTERM sorting domain-containing protein [bacterium]